MTLAQFLMAFRAAAPTAPWVVLHGQLRARIQVGEQGRLACPISFMGGRSAVHVRTVADTLGLEAEDRCALIAAADASSLHEAWLREALLTWAGKGVREEGGSQ